MFGTGGAFAYFQCADCRCLQIASVPEDLGRYYPPHYYSFNLNPVQLRGWKAWRHGRRDFRAVTGRGWLGRWLCKQRVPQPDLASLRRVGVQTSWNILDVGCGRGALLSTLWRAGFRHLAGIDPYLPADFEVTPGLVVRRKSLAELNERFDLVMLHHVFEHLTDPQAALVAGRHRIHDHGRILLRIPTVDSESWERYRENWVNLDAPRHLFLHSRRSIEILADRAGLVVRDWWCDADGFQFWGSELYRRGLPLFTADGQSLRLEDHFKTEELQGFAVEAARLNAAGRGDQVAVILSPASPSEASAAAR
jgi:SAM-dependent methyltransferase